AEQIVDAVEAGGRPDGAWHAELRAVGWAHLVAGEERPARNADAVVAVDRVDRLGAPGRIVERPVAEDARDRDRELGRAAGSEPGQREQVDAAGVERVGRD